MKRRMEMVNGFSGLPPRQRGHWLCVQKQNNPVYTAAMPMSNEQPNSPTAPQEWFATTHWSVVLAAGDSASPQIADALEQLCRTYWYPLFAFVRRSGHDEETAKDLTQSFFQRFLEKNYLKDVDRSRGRFRSFLLASAKHFLANEWDRQHSQRRGGGLEIISLDARLIETAEGQDQSLSMSPEKIFERRWALALLDAVKQRLSKEFADADKGPMFDALQAYLSGERSETPYAHVAAQLGMSMDAVKKAVERLRRRYGQLLREEIARTVAHPSEIDDEIRCLRATLQS